jgi:hypothetical protein
VFLPLAGLCGLILLIAIPFFSFGYFRAMLYGPAIVTSVPSPNGRHEAYVTENPSIDPPNQSLFVERRDKTHFMHIADLAEDIDAIIEVAWSPDSQVVVFHSKSYLTATRVADWQTVRVYLGKEWKRREPRRHQTTFTSGGIEHKVVAIGFPAAGMFSYRLAGDGKSREVRFNDLDPR